MLGRKTAARLRCDPASLQVFQYCSNATWGEVNVYLGKQDDTVTTSAHIKGQEKFYAYDHDVQGDKEMLESK